MKRNWFGLKAWLPRTKPGKITELGPDDQVFPPGKQERPTEEELEEMFSDENVKGLFRNG